MCAKGFDLIKSSRRELRVGVWHSPGCFRSEVLAVRRRERRESTEEAIEVTIEKRRAERPEVLAVG